MSTPLLEIALMDFNQLSAFVQTTTNGELYIANPSESTDTDREVCGEEILKIVVMPALKSEHKRVDSRSHRAQESDTILAGLLSSAALTYWVDRGFIIAKNARISRAISAQIKEAEIAEAKQDMIDLQLNTIGAILGAKKAHKKDAIQGFWDFDESELVAKQIGDEGTAGKLDTLEYDTNYRKAIAC